VKRRKSVALLIETSNAYARGLLEGIIHYHREHDAWSIYLPEQERGAAPPSWLKESDIDGVIARIETDAIAKAVSSLKVPVVDVSSARRVPNIPWIETDDQAIAKIAFEHLFERGFRNFAFCGPMGVNWSRWRQERFVARCNEAGLKYYLMGVFASAILLYGMSLVFGITGSTLLVDIGAELGSYVSSQPIITLGIAFVLIGFAFKVSLVPFHAWTPDVYQGAPTPITALMGSVGKVAAFAALLRVFTVALPSRADDWGPVVLVLAIATLLVGSVLAVIQTDVKRMLAYSSISHAGFILVGLEAASHVSKADSSLGVS
jgi:hypothetical protein